MAVNGKFQHTTFAYSLTRLGELLTLCVYNGQDDQGGHKVVRLRARIDEEHNSMSVSVGGAHALGHNLALGQSFDCNWYEDEIPCSWTDTAVVTDELQDCDFLMGIDQVKKISRGREQILAVIPPPETKEQRRRRKEKAKKHRDQARVDSLAEDQRYLLGQELCGADGRVYRHCSTSSTYSRCFCSVKRQLTEVSRWD